MRLALVTLSAAGAQVAERVRVGLAAEVGASQGASMATISAPGSAPGSATASDTGTAKGTATGGCAGSGPRDLYCHDSVSAGVAAERVTGRFARVFELMPRLFRDYDGILAIMPTGVVVRAIAPLIEHKLRDPAVVVTDVGGRWVISLLGGHEGGANDLTLAVANLLDAEPVITTTSEAARDVIVGIGCRKGTPAAPILDLVRDCLREAGVEPERVRSFATAGVKAREPGLLEAARTFGVPLRIIADATIRRAVEPVAVSGFVAERVALPGVAEPAALLAGRRTSFLSRRVARAGVTVALAREDCGW